MSNQDDVIIVYDKQCPFCDNYCQLIRLKESVGNLVLINAREDSAVLQEINIAGLDIDQGMVLKMQGTLYYGADAIHAIALLSSRNGMFNRVNYWIFRSKMLSRLLYPILRSIRNITLKLLKKNKINNLKLPNNQRF